VRHSLQWAASTFPNPVQELSKKKPGKQVVFWHDLHVTGSVVPDPSQAPTEPYCPTRHGLLPHCTHVTTSEVELPSQNPNLYCPVPHSLQAVQPETSLVVVPVQTPDKYEPCEHDVWVHAAHVMSLVAVHRLVMYCPSAHVLEHGRQTVVSLVERAGQDPDR